MQAAVEALMNNENFDLESDGEENIIYQSDEEVTWDDVDTESYIVNHEINSYSQQPFEAPNFDYDQNVFPHQEIDTEDIESNGDATKISKKQAAMELVLCTLADTSPLTPLAHNFQSM